MCNIRVKCASSDSWCKTCSEYGNFTYKKQFTICCDFDGTLCRHMYPDIGQIEPVNQSVIDYLKLQHSNHAIIILWTCRTGQPLQEAKDWCIANNIPVDFYNENPLVYKWWGKTTGKILGDLYIDDKAVHIDSIHKLMKGPV